MKDCSQNWPSNCPKMPDDLFWETQEKMEPADSRLQRNAHLTDLGGQIWGLNGQTAVFFEQILHVLKDNAARP